MATKPKPLPMSDGGFDGLEILNAKVIRVKGRSFTDRDTGRVQKYARLEIDGMLTVRVREPLLMRDFGIDLETAFERTEALNDAEYQLPEGIVLLIEYSESQGSSVNSVWAGYRDA